MKKLFLILTAVLLFFPSCFRTKTDNEAARINAEIRDSLAADSVNRRRNTPDTAIASFKRANYCDGRLMVVFDRVKMLSGEEAAEYAVRHKRFGNNLNIVINQEVTLETLPILPTTPVYLLKKINDTSAVNGFRTEYIETDSSVLADKENLTPNTVIEIIILHRSIIYFKQLEML